VQQLSIATRLYLLIGLSTLALTAVIAVALLGSGEMVDAGQTLHNRGAIAIKEISRITLLFKAQQQLVSRATAGIDRDRLQEYRTRFDQVSQKLSDQLIRLAPVADTLAQNSASQLGGLLGVLHEHASTVFDFAEDFVQDKANDVVDGPFSVVAGEIDAILDELLNAAAATADAEVEALSVTRHRMVSAIVAVSVLSVIIFNGFGIYIARRLTRDIGGIIAEMRALSAGDLESQMAADGDTDEIGAMARALEVFRFEMMAGRQMAAEARRSQEHLARAQQIAHMGSDIRNLRTDEAEWSDELYHIFGVSRETFVPSTENFLELLHPEDRAVILEARDKIKQGRCPEPFEYRVVRPDGALRHIYRETALIRDEVGNPVFLTGTCHDITEARAAQARERELERQLMHSQKLEALGTLAGGVAHDLNNTLVPILALSKLALEELPDFSPVRSDIETIIHASERARDLVKQILAFSRKQDLVKQEADLADVAHDALQMLRASLPTTIQIREQIGQVPPVFGDAGELHQVIVNLVTNAAQAIGDSVGKITVRVWATPQGPPSAGNTIGSSICLSVADTGCGMDQATIQRIFEPFFTTKAVGDGTGLGLAVVHGIVTRHGGTIGVQSKPGEGSEFTLSLPSDQRQTTPQAGAIAA
jgi:PAS domain S-box-containing protein